MRPSPPPLSLGSNVPPAVAAYLRTAFTRAVVSGERGPAWDLLSIIFGLPEAPPEDYTTAFATATATPALAARRLFHWVERHAHAHLGAMVPFPDLGRVLGWLRQRVRRHREFAAIYTEDMDTLLVFAQAVEISEATAQWRASHPERLPLPVLLLGETGTGKEVLARAMHALHLRMRAESAGDLKGEIDPESLFGPINCGGLPANLIESELFGHIKGAFTDARADRDGLIATHAKGTVFLDEIGDAPAEVQPRLLRFLNDGEVRPVGSDRMNRKAAWVITATHRDLGVLVRDGKFREDLFSRLAGHVLKLKPLRERGADILGALTDCVQRHAGRPLRMELSTPARHALLCNPWPGNLRTLDQVARRLVQPSRAASSVISVDLADLPHEIQHHYLFSVPLAASLSHEYAETVRILQPGERPGARSLLLEHYRNVMAQEVPEVRFVKTATRLLSSELIQGFLDEETRPKVLAACDALLCRTMRQHEEHLQRLLGEVDGDEILGVVSPELAEVVEDLPAWLRVILGFVEQLAGSPEAGQQLKRLEEFVDQLPGPLRNALSELVALGVAAAREEELLGDDGKLPPWKVVRADSRLFKKHLETAGSASRMAKRFDVSDRSVRTWADKHGLNLPGRKTVRKKFRNSFRRKPR